MQACASLSAHVCSCSETIQAWPPPAKTPHSSSGTTSTTPQQTIIDSTRQRRIASECQHAGFRSPWWLVVACTCLSAQTSSACPFVPHAELIRQCYLCGSETLG